MSETNIYDWLVINPDYKVTLSAWTPSDDVHHMGFVTIKLSKWREDYHLLRVYRSWELDNYGLDILEDIKMYMEAEIQARKEQK